MSRRFSTVWLALDARVHGHDGRAGTELLPRIDADEFAAQGGEFGRGALGVPVVSAGDGHVDVEFLGHGKADGGVVSPAVDAFLFE